MTDKRKLGRIFVTGADGFIGSHLVDVLVKQGHEVTALCMYNSIGSYGWLQHFARDTPGNLKLLLGDVRDQGMMQTHIFGHDTVFHLASLIAIPYSYLAPESYIDTNVKGSLNVALACQKNKVGRLIHTSTSEVYGTAKFVPITEEHPLQGQSPYSASKIGADMIMDSFWRSFKVPVVTLRPFNTYGPRQSLRAVIPTIIAQALQGTNVIKLGSLTPTRDFNYVADTVKAFISLAETGSGSVLGNTFNAGSGREISIEHLVRLIASLVGSDLKVNPEEERVRPEASEVERLLADSSKLTAATGWHPQLTLEQGLEETIAWIKGSEMKNDVSKYHV